MRVPRDPIELLAAARSGDRVALARLLSTVENDPAGARAIAPATWTASRGFTVGITGAPGAGKSTLTDALVTAVLARSPSEVREGSVARVAVLCVDPSSPFSGGAILGDRVRMQEHALDERVYIRSLATRGHTGGLSIAVPDALAVLGSLGFDPVFVETVGVGQVELEVAATAEMTVVVVTPGWGDAMQAAKAGILEVADLFVVNKADRPGATEARRDLSQMLDLGTGRDDGWRPPILETVASEGTGVAAALDAIDEFRAHLRGPSGAARRRARAAALVRRLAAADLAHRVTQVSATPGFDAVVDKVAAGDLDPYAAVDSLLAP